MNKSDSIKELASALSKAQSEISNPKKNAANPFFKSRYSDLSEVINVSKPVLSDHGLSILQMPMFSENIVSVETVLTHDSGEFISSTISMPVIKPDPQSIGSLISYCRRYAWAAFCGLAQEDDDGNAASGNHETQGQNELAWYNSFEADKEAMAKSIKDGKRTAEQIINNLCKTHKVSTKVREQIKQLEAA
jgi:hypothetical protein